MADTPRQGDLFRPEEKSDLESTVQDVPVPKNWGITKSQLNGLGYDTLEQIFYGIHNLDISSEMMDVLNPPEILSKYYGAGVVKRGGSHETRFQGKRFEEIYKELDRLAYGQPDFLTMSRRYKKNRFETTPGSQTKRLMELNPEVRDAFVESILEPYIPSTRESKSHGKFNDPNIDGRSKTIYVNTIFKIIETLYEKAQKA